MKKTLLIKLFVLMQILLIPIPALAVSVGESAGEIWVDGPDEVNGFSPSWPDAAVDSEGLSIFVYSSKLAPSGGTSEDVFLRAFDPGGMPQSDPVKINTYDDNIQRIPRMAISGDDSFMVIWQSFEPAPNNPDVDRIIIRGQAFDANRDPVGNERLLSSVSTSIATQVYADVAALRDGGYVVVWHSLNTLEVEDPDTTGIQARRLGANGAPLAEQFQVHPNTFGHQNNSSVTGLADGGFLIVWTTPEVHGRRFKADGTAQGDVFQINTFTTGTEVKTDVVMHEDGRVLVVWQSNEERIEGNEIRGRLYSPNLVAQGPDFRINSLTAEDQLNPRVADYGQAGFFVVWGSVVSAGSDIDPKAIEGRVVTGSDQFTGPEFQLNQYTPFSQHDPGIGGRNDRVAVAWASQRGPETSSNVILGQSWAICGIFCDSFE